MKNETNEGLKVGSIVLGVFGIILCIFPYFGIVLSGIATWLGYKSNSTAGKVLGIIGLVLNAIAIAIMLVLVATIFAIAGGY